jgi:hypothetical protein
MGVFDDKKFERLDWMTQITETIESELNGLLARLPDRIEVDAKRVSENVGTWSHFSIEVGSVIRDFIRENSEFLMWEEDRKLIECYKFEGDPILEYNAETEELVGKLVLVKVVPTLSDEELQAMMGARGIDKIGDLDMGDAENWNLERINEILDVLGDCEADKRNRSFRKKMRRIAARLEDIFKNNEWRIRDMELANRVGVWIANYIEHGNLAALTNLCKLKVMTHNNMPIYSMEEEK